MLSALSLSRKWKTEPSVDSVHKFPRSINKAIKQLYIHCNFPSFWTGYVFSSWSLCSLPILEKKKIIKKSGATRAFITFKSALELSHCSPYLTQFSIMHCSNVRGRKKNVDIITINPYLMTSVGYWF